jgi:hypothetical protein
VQPQIEHPRYEISHDDYAGPKVGWPAFAMAAILVLLVIVALIVHLA